MNQRHLSMKKFFRQECVYFNQLKSSVLLSEILQRSVWKFVAIQMQERCLNESAWKNCHTSTEPSVSPWILTAEILECFSQTPKQSRSSSFMMSRSVYRGSCVGHSDKGCKAFLRWLHFKKWVDGIKTFWIMDKRYEVHLSYSRWLWKLYNMKHPFHTYN